MLCGSGRCCISVHVGIVTGVQSLEFGRGGLPCAGLSDEAFVCYWTVGLARRWINVPWVHKTKRSKFTHKPAHLETEGDFPLKCSLRVDVTNKSIDAGNIFKLSLIKDLAQCPKKAELGWKISRKVLHSFLNTAFHLQKPSGYNKDGSQTSSNTHFLASHRKVIFLTVL